MSELNPEDIGALKQAVTTLTAEVSLLRQDMTKVNLALSELRGGKKVLLTMLATAGLFGSALTWLLQHIQFK